MRDQRICSFVKPGLSSVAHHRASPMEDATVTGLGSGPNDRDRRTHRPKHKPKQRRIAIILCLTAVALVLQAVPRGSFLPGLAPEAKADPPTLSDADPAYPLNHTFDGKTEALASASNPISSPPPRRSARLRRTSISRMTPLPKTRLPTRTSRREPSVAGRPRAIPRSRPTTATTGRSSARATRSRAPLSTSTRTRRRSSTT